MPVLIAVERVDVVRKRSAKIALRIAVDCVRSIGEYCVLALGSVVTKKIAGEWQIVAGMPAKAVKPLDEDSKVLVTYPTRPDLEGLDNALPPAS